MGKEYDRVCPICLKEFIAKRKNIICCCQLCASIRWKRNNKEKNYAISKKWHQEHKDRKAISDKKYSTKNKEKLKEYRKKYYLANKKEICKKNKKRYIINKDKIKITVDRWRLSNLKKHNKWRREYTKNKREKDPSYKIRANISSRVHSVIKGRNKFKTFELLGYTSKDLKTHLESKFKEGMSWDNYGMYGWHIDHIRPTASFIFINKDGDVCLEQVKECWSLENLQPLWATENILKGSKYKIGNDTYKFIKGKKHDITS